MQSQDNHLLETIKSVFVPIHPTGWPFIAIFFAVFVVLALISSFLGWIGFILLFWCVYFFRNPNRISPIREGLIISPADGIVQTISKVIPPAELELGEDEHTRVSIFLNVFDVHVNRIPIAGSISKLHYEPGKFLNASLDKASEENERQIIKITTPDDASIGVVQIAGLVARRIVCDLIENQPVKTGEQFGIIRFGSRVDVYLPPDVMPMVMIGQRMVGGETIIADIKSNESNRIGTKH
ncbi:MAG: phosphatidylserine decarboxylase [Rickettsiales bacterium]